MKLKIRTERLGVLLVSLFYVVVGVILIFILALASFRLFHVGVLAVLNLIVAYGLFKMKKWSVKLLAVLFLPQVVFGIITLFYSATVWTVSSFLETAVFNLLIIVYVFFCFVSLAYVAAKREDFK